MGKIKGSPLAVAGDQRREQLARVGVVDVTVGLAAGTQHLVADQLAGIDVDDALLPIAAVCRGRQVAGFVSLMKREMLASGVAASCADQVKAMRPRNSL